MLLELAVGDAYGAGFEYVNLKIVRAKNDLANYVQHPRHLRTLPGMYTDDTQMTIAIAELIVENVDWTAANIADKFVDCFKRDPREGYAASFHKFLTEVQSGSEFLAKIRAESEKSGAAMRSAPIGLFGTVEEVVEKCHVQAAVTHDTLQGRAAACAAALMVHYFIYDLGPKQELANFIACHIPGPWQSLWVGQVGPLGIMSVHAAISATAKYDSLSALLKGCIDYGGDVDTVATIALAAAACSSEYEQDLPPSLIDTLENADFGRNYLRQLDSRLMQRFEGRRR